MVSEYVVLQYGNVISGEYTNIAVYSYDTANDKPKVYSKFLENWDQVEGSQDEIFQALLNTWLKKIETKEALQEAIRNSNSTFSSLLFTAPRSSVSSAETLLEEMSKLFLVE
jgi:hypothetical protein